jgi:hypothetical protein
MKRVGSVSSQYLRSSFIATSVVYIVTTFHHLYGAKIYNTPWRKDVGINGGLILFICFIFLFLFSVYKKNIFLTLYSVISFIVFEFGIGLFEGLYNHVLKNVLFFCGMPLSTWRKLFPAPAYEIPDNLLFESTGILQFFVALISTFYLLKIYKNGRKTTASSHG